jgi:small-conductance mechanosensitive channel
MEILPQALWAILILISGFLISKWLGRGVANFLDKTKINQALKRLGMEEALAKIDARLNAPKFFGELICYSSFLLFLIFSSEILGLVQFGQFLAIIIGYLPNIFVAALIFIVAVFLTDFSQKIITGTLEKERITYSGLLGRGLSWTIWVLAILAILYQLKITPNLILTIFIGAVATLVLILGISFGLGGKDLAAKILKELEEKFK